MLKRIPRRIKLWWWRLIGKAPKWLRYVSCSNCHDPQWVNEGVLCYKEYSINGRTKRKSYGAICQKCGKFVELYSVPERFRGRAVAVEEGES